jgi:CheY-like chemotaxis protein
VVEDEDMIARYVQAVLGRHGYRTFLARDGAEAWKLWQNRKGPIDLLLTDIVMPNGMSGKDLAERLSAEIPEVPIVFTSGYSLDVLGLDPNLGASRYLLQKPYQSEVLLDTIRRALDAKGAGPGHIVHLPRDCDKSLPGTESNVQPPKPLPPT